MSKRSFDGSSDSSHKRHKRDGHDGAGRRNQYRVQQSTPSDAYQGSGKSQRAEQQQENLRRSLDNVRSNGPAIKQRSTDKASSNAPASPRTSRDTSIGTSDALPPATSQSANIPYYIPFKVKARLPELPIVVPRFAEAPFRHKSSFGYDRTSSSDDMTYEKLEFLGDAYIEVFASRLIFEHFPTLTAGNQSQVRELLVKNETLAEYARAYNFEQRLNLSDQVAQSDAAKNRGNKGMNKILGDTFEAYVAAIVQGDVEHGFAIAEKWLTTLWTPKLLEHVHKHFNLTANILADEGVNLLMSYDPTAKATIQQKLLGAGVKLEYETYREPEELKGDQLGHNRHYIALYLTGYGYDRKLLGQGDGKNKVEAGNWAATRAMHGETKAIVDDCAAQLAKVREAKKKEKARQEALVQT
ncbi:hypothetical protein AMS68_004188 [Peltaster fructicola]|uniref:RNase III domain-containing protein n=1 Tax=Peltaster fructicola TaxID=286661 RepID=A0A6H0XVI7_9PEZI|nr:hypothetical protein AMS68_004188 [Peltaster fructicola]